MSWESAVGDCGVCVCGIRRLLFALSIAVRFGDCDEGIYRKLGGSRGFCP